jgi:hypothetical protein
MHFHSSARSGIIAGSVLAGAAAISVACFYLYYRRRRNSVHNGEASGPQLLGTRSQSSSFIGSERGFLARIAKAYEKSKNIGNSEDRLSQTLPILTVEAQTQRRQERQAELQNQLNAVQAEIQAFQEEATERFSQTPRKNDDSEQVESSDIWSQLRRAEHRNVYLQQQLESAWALGLSDDPPPAYNSQTL